MGVILQDQTGVADHFVYHGTAPLAAVRGSGLDVCLLEIWAEQWAASPIEGGHGREALGRDKSRTKSPVCRGRRGVAAVLLASDGGLLVRGDAG